MGKQKLEEELADSQRVPKGRFNIFRVVALDSKPNYFIGSLIGFFVLAILCPIAAFIWIDKLDFLFIMPLFGLGTLGVATKFFFEALITYRFGRQYICKIEPISLACILVVAGKRIKLSHMGVLRSFADARCLAIYDEMHDSILILRASKRFVSDYGNICNSYEKNKKSTISDKNENATVFACEDELIQKRFHKKELVNSKKSPTVNCEFKSLKSIVASDKKATNSLPFIIILSSIVTLIASILSLLYFVFGVNKDLFIALLVVGGVINALCLFGIVVCFFSYLYLRRLLKGATLIYSKMTGMGRIIESHESDTGNWQTAHYYVEYQIIINGVMTERKSYPAYDEEEISKIRRIQYFPILFNKKMNDALYFTMEHCQYLNRINSLQ